MGSRTDDEKLLVSLILDNARRVHLSRDAYCPRVEFDIDTPYPATWVLNQYDNVLREKGMSVYDPRRPAFATLRKWINGEMQLKDRSVWEHYLGALWVFTAPTGAKKQFLLDLTYSSPSPTYYVDSMSRPTNDRLHVSLAIGPFRTYEAAAQTRTSTGTAP